LPSLVFKNLKKRAVGWVRNYWGLILIKISELRKGISMDFDNNPAEEKIACVIKIISELEKMLEKTISFETFVSGGELRSFALKQLVLGKWLIKGS